MGYIDSRELISEREELLSEIEDYNNEEDPELRLYTPEEIEDMQKRADAIEELGNDIGGESQYGVTLIPEYEFEDYARQFAEDIGAIDADTSWPATCIDWEKAASEL